MHVVLHKRSEPNTYNNTDYWKIYKNVGAVVEKRRGLSNLKPQDRIVGRMIIRWIPI